jgi:hypothetical protein
MRGPFLEVAPSLLVDLGRGHVPAAEQLLDLDDISSGIIMSSAQQRTEIGQEARVPQLRKHSLFGLRP